jgi:hypothetical protein
MSNPFEDDSRWTLMGSRFDNSDLHQMFNEMFEEWVESLPVDDPARLLHYMLPKPPGYNYGTDPRAT